MNKAADYPVTKCEALVFLINIMEQYGAYDNDVLRLIIEKIPHRTSIKIFYPVMYQMEYEHILQDKRMVKQDGNYTNTDDKMERTR